MEQIGEKYPPYYQFYLTKLLYPVFILCSCKVDKFIHKEQYPRSSKHFTNESLLLI